MGTVEEFSPEIEAAVFPPPKNVAVLGYSPDPRRPSHEVAAALGRWGFVVFPVNPYAVFEDGQRAFACLAEVPGPLDIVVVFRRSEHVREHEADILAKKPRVIWLQDGVRDPDLAARARAEGIHVVQDDCIARRYASWAAGHSA